MYKKNNKYKHMKFAFSILLIIHGLIHLLGYIKAFFETETSKQIVGVSKPIGSIWLVTFILFMIVAIQFLTNKKWFYLGLVAVLISQTLIILAWQDAKLGTIANILILLVSTSAFATHKFNTMVESESKHILQNINLDKFAVISENDVLHLPQIVRKWLFNSGTMGNPKVQTVRLKQVGTMRTKPNSNWMPFEAMQYFNTKRPSFVWQTKVSAMPLITMMGRDKLMDGKGEMLIKLAGLLPVVNVSDNLKINSGAMLRYLAEICWFPSAVLNDYITWKTVDSNSAKATFNYKNQSVSGIFTFNDNGDFTSFKAYRYYGNNKNSQLEKWQITVDDYKVFHDIKIPSQCKVSWQLKDGDFNWLNVEIIDIDYNLVKLY